MTKTTLKALWVVGGGAAATWFAVAPGQHDAGAPAATPAVSVVESRDAQEAELQAKTELLQKRVAEAELTPPTRNPFRFGSSRSAAGNGGRGGGPVRADTLLPPPPPPPTLTLAGIAEKETDAGTRRMAIISSDTKLYVSGEGDVVEGRYTIVAVDPERVLLRDFAGGELRLILRP